MDILIRLNLSGNLVLRHSCRCRLGSLPLSAARKGRNARLRKPVRFSSRVFDSTWEARGWAKTSEPARVSRHCWVSSFVLAASKAGAVLCWTLIWSFAGHGDIPNINMCVWLCFYPRLHFELQLCFTGICALGCSRSMCRLLSSNLKLSLSLAPVPLVVTPTLMY